MFQFIILLLPVSLGFSLVGDEREINLTQGLINKLGDEYPTEKTFEIFNESLTNFIQTIEDLIAEINETSSVYLENLSNETMTHTLRSSILNTSPCSYQFEIDKLKESFIVELGLLEIPLREAISELKDKISGMKRSVDIERSALKVKLELCELTGDWCKNETVLNTHIQCLNGSCSSEQIPVLFHDSLELPPTSLNRATLYPYKPRRKLLPTECPGGLFKCANRYCIDSDLVCDGRRHCPDYSDETNYCTSEPTCAGKRCRNLHCISEEDICNGIDDCGDGTDEANCPSVDDCGIDSETYICSDRSKCLNLIKVCDGKADCKDGSDESDRCSDSSICKNCSLVGGSCLHTPTGPICLRKCPTDFILNLKDGICIPRNSSVEHFIGYNSNSFLGIVDNLKILSARFSSGFILLKKNMNYSFKKTLLELNKCNIENNIGSLNRPFIVH